MIRNCRFNGIWILIHQTSVKFATTPTNRGCPTCRALHELQDNSISQQVVRQARQIIPKKAEAHVAMEIIGCEKQAARFCWCLGWFWDSLDSLDSFNLVNSELNQTGPECHEVRLRAIHGLRHRRDSQTDHLSSQRPGENGDQGPKVGSFPVATGNWDEKSRFTTYCNQTYSASPSWMRFRYWFQTLRNLHLRQCFQVLNDRVLFEYSWNRSAGTLHCKIWGYILLSPLPFVRKAISMIRREPSLVALHPRVAISWWSYRNCQNSQDGIGDLWKTLTFCLLQTKFVDCIHGKCRGFRFFKSGNHQLLHFPNKNPWLQSSIHQLILNCIRGPAWKTRSISSGVIMTRLGIPKLYATDFVGFPNTISDDLGIRD